MKDLMQDGLLFISAMVKEQRIPHRDKLSILFLLALLMLRILFIPDWIPYLTKLDAVIIIGLLSDYFFNILDQNLLLSHYPWGMKSFARIKRFFQFLAIFAPGFITRHLWLYTKEPF